MKVFTKLALFLLFAGLSSSNVYSQKNAKIVQDAEFYVIEAQNGEKWAKEDVELDKRLAELKKKHGKAPNIVYILWDDMAFGDAGIPAINKIRGFDTPGANKMAEEGILFTRMYAEPSCTPTRAAFMTGRGPYRNGMFIPGFPVENGGLAAEEVTIAEVLSDAGYATAFYGKGHLGDIEESYLTNQGFDEALFTPYNQVLSLWNPIGEGANAVIAMAVVGGVLGFLRYNTHPAKVFMGDTGSLTLGGIIAAIAILIRKEMLIPILCGIFLLEN